MNQLEYFLASTDGSRADVMRYMQRLRDLDEWVEHHLTLLRAIAASRVALLSNAAAEHGRPQRSRRAHHEQSQGRGRGRAASGRRSTAVSTHPTVIDVDDDRSGGISDDDDDEGAVMAGLVSKVESNAEVAAYMSELHREFEWHETCVRQYTQEREALAAELAERCAEVRLSMASRLANFASVADVPATEFSN